MTAAYAEDTGTDKDIRALRVFRGQLVCMEREALWDCLTPLTVAKVCQSTPVMLQSRTTLLGFVFAVAPLFAADPPPAAAKAEVVVELPKFEVTDSRILPPPEKWHYATIPGFEILSNVSVGKTKAFVRDFLLLQDALTVLMPAFGQGDVAVPVSLILCGGPNGFDRFVPVDRGDDIYRTNVFFYDDPERTAIIVDLAQGDVQLDAATTAQVDPYRGFYKEYFRHLIRHKAGHVPAWFEEGLVQLLSAIDFNKKWITFAQISDATEPDPNLNIE